MSLNHLSNADVALIGECLKAAAHGPFFGQPLDEDMLGFNINELIEVSSKWPNITSNNKTRRIINNVLAAFMSDGYPLLQQEKWSKWISTSPSEIDETLPKWRRLDIPLTEKEAFEIASQYACKNDFNLESSKIENNVPANFEISIAQSKAWGWVFRLELPPDYPSRVVVVNRFDGYHIACPTDKSDSFIKSYEIALSKWATS